MESYNVKNLNETIKLAQIFAKTLKGGEVILLSGDLGAGKTTFTKALFKKLGVKENVTSPTFNLLREYKTKKFNLNHFDMYRISDPQEVIEFGFSEYLFNPNSITVIEWYENIKEILNGNFIKIEITKIDENKRKFDFYRGIDL